MNCRAAGALAPLGDMVGKEGEVQSCQSVLQLPAAPRWRPCAKIPNRPDVAFALASRRAGRHLRYRADRGRALDFSAVGCGECTTSRVGPRAATVAGILAPSSEGIRVGVGFV